MGVNPGGDMSPPHPRVVPPQKNIKEKSLSIVKNICMYIPLMYKIKGFQTDHSDNITRVWKKRKKKTEKERICI